MIISVFDREKNIVGKGEIACTSNFSISHSVFKRLLSQRHQKVSLCGNGLNIGFWVGKNRKHGWKRRKLVLLLQKSRIRQRIKPGINGEKPVCATGNQQYNKLAAENFTLYRTTKFYTSPN